MPTDPARSRAPQTTAGAPAKEAGIADQIEALRSEVEQAWAKAYSALAEAMMRGAKEPQATREFG